MTRFALLLLAAGLLSAALAAKDDATTDLKKLEGSWVLASGVDDGKKQDAEARKGASLVIKGNKHTVKVAGNTYVGTHKLNPAKSPKTIDITDTEGPFKDKTVRGIYKVDGDEFALCFDPSGETRPKDFAAKAGSGFHSHVWKRKKK
jgi:uncharacterized protein (TIGR03067 family)